VAGVPALDESGVAAAMTLHVSMNPVRASHSSHRLTVVASKVQGLLPDVCADRAGWIFGNHLCEDV